VQLVEVGDYLVVVVWGVEVEEVEVVGVVVVGCVGDDCLYLVVFGFDFDC